MEFYLLYFMHHQDFQIKLANIAELNNKLTFS